MKRIVIVLALALVAGCVNAPVGIDPGDPAPNFEVTDTDFNKVRLSDFEQKPVLLFFFSVSCGTCQGETRNVLVPLEQDVGDAVGFVSLTIGYDETRDDLVSFKQDTGAQWPHAWDVDYVAQDYGVYAPSTVVVLDKEHRMVYRAVDPDRATIEGHLGVVA